MTAAFSPPSRGIPVAVIGAGIGGLVAAARLAQAGCAVTVFDAAPAPGGKMRALPSDAGPVDAGPTVLTMRSVFDDLFFDLGERLDDHVTLIRQPLLARHFWPDGTHLDLFDDAAKNRRAIQVFAGTRAASQFALFDARARRLFDGLDGPIMQASRPSGYALAARLLARPRLLADLAPLSSLAKLLDRCFDDPRLAQLFGRYATYVGGSPYGAPALLSLIWQAEAAGVWAVQGGMHRLASALAALACARGARIVCASPVARIEMAGRRVTGLVLRGGERVEASAVLFNGDPRALATGLLGAEAVPAAPGLTDHPRSLSAEVWAFAARAIGPDLAHHNVFFRDDPAPEFAALAQGRRVADPTLYVCAMDRGTGAAPAALERFEIIANAPPLTARDIAPEQETPSCRTRCFQTLSRFGLRFDPIPGPDSLTTPQGFETLFPGSAGALYGQSPHGLMAAFRRPLARTGITGLYLAGGGAHPGAGVPMAALSGRHAAEAILSDRISTSPSRRTVMPGGMSTGSATTAPAPSASSPS